MRRPIFAVALLTFAACAGAKPSRWEPREPRPGPRIICECTGVERGPRPGEASSDTDETVVLAMCEGAVKNCHPARSSGPNRELLD